jgi:hypothetical protein
MITKLISSLIAVLATFYLNASPDPGEREKIELVASRYQVEQAKTWPTLSWQESPLIVTFDNGHIYALGLKTNNPAWTEISMGKTTVLYTEKDQWGLSQVHLQPWFEIEGQKAFVYRMGNRTPPKDDATTLAHERFHRHQMEHFDPGSMGESRDHMDIENLTWSEIEDELFRSFLSAKGEQKKQILRDIAAVHGWRRSIISKETRGWEDNQMKMEGLADYVGTHLYGGGESLLRMHPEDHRDGIVDEAIKWRHYLAGATLGYALDSLNVPNWKEQIEEGQSLSDLLINALPLSQKERSARLDNVKNRLSYAKRRKAMANRIRDYQKELNAVYRDYDQQKGVKLLLDHPPVAISGGGSNLKLYYLADGSTVNIDDESVSTTRDGKWKFSTHNAAHLFQHKDGFREVKLSQDARVTLDHISLSLPDVLKSARKYTFDSLKIDGLEASFESQDHPGELVSDGRTIQVTFLERVKQPSA